MFDYNLELLLELKKQIEDDEYFNAIGENLKNNIIYQEFVAVLEEYANCDWL